MVNYQYTTYDQVSRVYGTGLPNVRHYYYSNGTPKATTVNGDTVMTYTGDSKGRITSSTDADGHQTTRTYEGSGFKNLSTVAAGGQTTTQRYDGYGRPRYRINALQDTVTINYDAINRVTSTVDEAGDTTSFGYNLMYRTSVTDARSQVFQNHPNALGWDTTVVDPGNRTERYKYDKDGLVRSYTNRRNQTVTHAYNAAHERTSMTAGGQTTTYSVSTDFLTQTADNAHSTDTIKLNKSGQVLEEITWRAGQRVWVARTYDAALRPWTVKVMKGITKNTVTYGYDTAGRLDELQATNAGTTTIGYDPRFNAETFYWSSSQDTLVLKHPSVGAPGQYRYSDATVQDSAGLHYARDALRRTSERWNGDMTQWDEFSRDPVGRLTSIITWEENDPGSANCTWDDNIGDYCEESSSTSWVATESFLWDEVGNPSNETVDADNRLRTLGSISLTYDADGNIKTRSGGGETVTYWWNALSQLDSASSSVSGKIRYRYDGFGRRVYTQDAVDTTLFLWDGDDLVADISPTGALERYYNYYPGIANIHSMRLDGSSSYLYIKDVAGNVLGLQNSSGTLVNTYTYSPFGETTADESGGVANRFRFASGEQDRLGLYYFRARHYEPEYMRFLSQDPIGLAGGINPYVYAGNNPIDNWDPTGLECDYYNVNGETIQYDVEAGTFCLDGLTVTVDKGGSGAASTDARQSTGGDVTGGGGQGDGALSGSSRRAAMMTRCDQDMTQFMFNVGLHMTGLGVIRAARLLRNAPTPWGPGVATSFTYSFVPAPAINAVVWASGHGRGSPNPYAGTGRPVRQGAYEAAKMFPFTSLAVDGRETAVSCFNAVFNGG